MCFLDLNIYIESGTLKTRTHFKPTGVNSYIGHDSCHYRPWINNTPKGQFKRLKMNCSEVS